MFAKAEWFSRCGRGLRPNSRQGRLYLGLWAALWGIPTLMMLASGLRPEALIWTVTTIGFVAWEMRQVSQRMKITSEPNEVLYISDGPDGTPAEVR